MRREFEDSEGGVDLASFKIPKKKKYNVYTPSEWKQWYISTMLNKGVDYEDALLYFEGIEFGTPSAIYDCSDDPESAALEDLQY